MELIAISRRHLDDGNTGAAVETALEACKHNGPAGEPPDLRDARINLIMKVLHYARTAMGNEEFEMLQALLERRIFNFLQRGDDFAERNRFPWLFPYGSGVFDGGRDRPRPISLDEYKGGAACKSRSSRSRHPLILLLISLGVRIIQKLAWRIHFG